MKPSQLKCYPQVAAVIGEALADYELQRVIDCNVIAYNKSRADVSFTFSKSPQGYDFWRLVNSSQNPYEHGHEKPEVKEWAYIRDLELDFKDEWFCKKDNKWVASDDTYHIVGGDGIEILETHKSVTMPDWVPEETIPESDSGDKERSDGSTASYYELPEGATELQHLISHRNMNYAIGSIFSLCYDHSKNAHSSIETAIEIRRMAEFEIKRLEKMQSMRS